MARYVILSNFHMDSMTELGDLRDRAARVKDKIKRECPNVEWKDSFALLGRFDVIDIIEAKHAEDAEKAAMIIRTYGRANTETLRATPWKDFLDNL
jgi:uncharacterized protein with GYD domain